MPLLGFGTYKLAGQVCYDSVLHALEAGYRHLDTADRYNNHEVIAKAIKDSGVKRDGIFITSKVYWNNLARDEVIRVCEQSLKELQTDYIDLLLIHWPNRTVPIAETLGAFDECRKQGKVRAIGVSNFTVHHLQDVAETGITIQNHQFELRPLFVQSELIAYCKENNISITAHTQFGQGADLVNQEIRRIADNHARTPAEVILSWLRSHGYAALPKAEQIPYIDRNLDSLTLELSAEDISHIDTLPQGKRILVRPVSDFEY